LNTQKSRSILIISGNSQEAQTLERILQFNNFHTRIARRALDGLDIARNHPIDLIVTAIDLPDMSGREMAIALRTESQIPIVALVDVDNVETREMNIAAGINGFVTRPLNIDALPVYLEFYLSGGRDAVDDRNRLDAARERFMQDMVKRLEGRIRELERKNDALERLDQMKDDFIQLTAHELRTPLTLLTGYARLLEDHPSIQRLLNYEADFRTVLGEFMHAMDRMGNIVEEVLITSRIMTKKIELNITQVYPLQIVQRVVEIYGSALQQRRLTVHVDQTKFPPIMLADGDLLRLMFANLISNAIKYTPDGGNIYVNSQFTDTMVRFSIRDTGIGIAPEQQSRIFERLYISRDVALHGTSKTAFGGGGLGLGLAICRGIIEAHGGKISVQSEGYDPHQLPGSEFIVIMPTKVVRSTTGKLKRLTAPLG
jgi:signal transduction histidine kinase